jgi:hypothetical protein
MKTWKKTAALLLLTTAFPALADAPATIAAPANSAYLEIGAQHTLPQAITVHGQVVKLDRQPLMQEKTLYVPLRFIVEAAGGTVAWQAEAQQITVTLPDRTAVFVIGQDQAELNERGVFYIQRNLIKMERPVIVVEGRTMISAEALSKILGMVEQADTDLNMDLVARPAKGAEAPLGKVREGDAQVTAMAVTAAAVPAEMQSWASGLTVEQGPSFKVSSAADGSYVGIAGGMQPTGGYTIELIGGQARHVDGTWYIEARVVPPSGMATQVLTNPVAFYHLPGVTGTVKVNFWMNGATP